MRERLSQVLGDLDLLLVNRWLNDPKEKKADIEETVGLMLQVLAGLMGEVDVFIGSVDTTEPGQEQSELSDSTGSEDTEMVDLVSDEPIASLLSIEAPFHISGSGAP